MTKPKKATHKEAGKIKRLQASKQEAVMKEERRRQRDEPKFKTKVVDYSKLVSIRVDERTVIYIKRGDNPEEAKHKYLQRKIDKQNRLRVK